jgi:hypothetical protein
MGKQVLLHCSKQPPRYTSEIIEIACEWVPIAAALSIMVTLWSFGHQDVFPSGWSFLKQPFMDLAAPDGMPDNWYSKSSKIQKKREYQTANSELRLRS